jgi:hypothetical protein
VAFVKANPMVFETSDVGSTDHIAVLGTSGRLRIHGIRWIGQATVGDVIQITDNAGKVIWHSVCSAVMATTESELHWWLRDGLRLAVMASGRLYVYLEEGPG